MRTINIKAEPRTPENSRNKFSSSGRTKINEIAVSHPQKIKWASKNEDNRVGVGDLSNKSRGVRKGKTWKDWKLIVSVW